jgi:hypothetical protein
MHVSLVELGLFAVAAALVVAVLPRCVPQASRAVVVWALAGDEVSGSAVSLHAEA